MKWILILAILFSVVIAHAEDEGIFYILNETIIDHINELPVATKLSPEMNIIGYNDDLAGWIDIVGFRNMSRMGGINYTYGDPAKEAIVMSEVGILEYGKLVSIKKAQTHGYVYDSITKTITVYTKENKITAKMHIVLKKHSCNTNTCGYSEDVKDIYDEEYSPVRYTYNSSFNVSMTQYNNSLYETIGIHITNISGMNEYSIQLNDSAATYHINRAHVERTAKGVYFANVTPTDSLDFEGNGMSKYGNMILMNGNLSKIIDNISITGMNLYETKTSNSSKYNITRQEFKPEKDLDNPVLISFMGILSALFGGAYFLIQRMRLF